MNSKQIPSTRSYLKIQKTNKKKQVAAVLEAKRRAFRYRKHN